MKEKLERTEAFEQALALMGGEAPFVFITGRAGTGKSTLLKTFRDESSLVCPILAPTGVAALNVGGETIHRFFHFAPGMNIRDARRRGLSRKDEPIWRSIDGFVIDEISMVRADLLDNMDMFLRSALGTPAPFGGKRIIAIGDLAQLPPVVARLEREAFAQAYETPYFFSSQAVQEIVRTQGFKWQELETVYRQTDQEFIRLLNAIRDRNTTNDDLQKLNARVEQLSKKEQRAHDIILTTTNEQADKINESHLSSLRGEPRSYDARVVGEFKEKDAPTDTRLTLKKGARVMCIANDSAGAYVNGSLGTVAELTESGVVVDLDNDTQVVLDTHTWAVFQTRFDDESKSLLQEKIGSFEQIPLRLAWAITIHKSQGKTFDRLVLDLERGAFAHGQVYVALSRSRSLQGITLTQPIRPQHLHIDEAVTTFIDCLRQGIPFPVKGQSLLL